MSDQDFFFDEEDDAKPAAKAGPAGKTPRASQPAPAATGGSFFMQSVTMAVTSLVAVIALLLGLIVGILIPTGGSTVPTGTPPVTAAPALSEDQLNSGQMPAGHPDISGAATESAATTGTGN